MDNQELLSRVAEMMRLQTETLDKRFDKIDKRFDVMDKRFDAMDERMDAMDARMDAIEKHIDEGDQNIIHEVRLIIENDVSKRIESLYDGYMLTHEKQHELERTVGKLRELLDQALLRIAVLEQKIA